MCYPGATRKSPIIKNCHLKKTDVLKLLINHEYVKTIIITINNLNFNIKHRNEVYVEHNIFARLKFQKSAAFLKSATRCNRPLLHYRSADPKKSPCIHSGFEFISFLVQLSSVFPVPTAVNGTLLRIHTLAFTGPSSLSEIQ